jgi:hypothetical protein
MHPSKAVRTVVLVVTTLYMVVLALAHATLTSWASRVLGLVPTGIGYGLVVFDLWAWRFSLINPFVGRPYIAGTWYGTLEPSGESVNPQAGNRGLIPTALVIEQSYWSIALTLMTAESSSRSTSAAIRTDAENSARRVLAYSYANEPDQKHLARSRAHLGAAHLRVVGRAPKEISGSYWTNRFTAGDMTFRFVTRKVDFPTLDSVVTAATDNGTI